MSVHRPEPGEYGWMGYEAEERLAAELDDRRRGWRHPVYTGEDGVSTDLEGAAWMARQGDVEIDLIEP